MKASDTILDESGKLGCSLVGKLPYKDYKAVIDEACLHQAETSFKAGIKEVVEWIEKNTLSDSEMDDVIPYGLWQSKLKEWGIE